MAAWHSLCHSYSTALEMVCLLNRHYPGGQHANQLKSSQNLYFLIGVILCKKYNKVLP